MISTKNKRRNKILFLVILLLALSIGFAALSTTLKINGTANIGKNSWNIYWDNVANKTGVTPVSGPIIGNDSQGGVNTQVTFEVNLNEPGDFYEFTVDAVNAGTLDAMITSINQTLNGNPVTSQNKLPDYIKFNVTYADGVEIGQYHLLPKATVSGNTTTPTVETYKVRIEYDRDKVDSSNLPANDTTYTLTYSITYAQADEHAIPKPSIWTLPNGKTKDNLTLGDEICLESVSPIENQCFNFIKYDGNDVVMLSKYNLNVGSNAKGSETFLQESNLGSYGQVKFSNTNYWVETVSRYNADVYDAENYTGTPKENNYSVAYYVEQYKTKLINDYHTIIKNARLLTYSETADSSIGCSYDWDMDLGSCPKTGVSAFITNTSFWLGTAKYTEILWTVSANGAWYYNYYDSTRGVRPVIVVEKSNL